MPLTRLAVAAVLVAGCFSPSPPSGRPCSAVGECPDGLICSPQNTCEQTLGDAPRIDAARDASTDDSSTDAALVDACTSCSLLVAHYRFDGALDDVTGLHPGAMINGVAGYVAGVDGQALKLPASAAAYVRVEDSPAFDLPSGRIELRFRFAADAPTGDLGLFSRDANASSLDGHVSLRIGHDRRVVLRIQRQSEPTIEAYRCTALPMSASTWHHVDATFGPDGLVLRVDGSIVTGTSWTSASSNGTGATVPCTTAWTRGIAGNDNPIVIGALTITSVEGTGVPATAIAGGVELDDVKLWALP